MILARLLIVVLAVFLVSGCGDGSDAPEAETPAPAETDPGAPSADEPEFEPVVYQDDFAASIKPIIEESCSGCHLPGGPGASHVSMATAGEVRDAAPLIAAQVSAGVMPPWPAGGDSPEFLGDRRLREDQIRAIVDWSRTGEINVPAKTPIAPGPPVDALTEIDMEITPEEGYTGSPGEVDHYRCQVYDPEVTERTWLQGFEFVPEKTEVVHHAIAYQLDASARAQAEEEDASAPGAGWPCFGSSGLDPAAETFALGWAPGQSPTIFPEGSGLPIAAGDFFVVQVHYHYDDDRPEDRSALKLDFAEPPETGTLDDIVVTEFVAPAEIPCGEGESGPLCDRETALAAAKEKYGPEGVRANETNIFCGTEPEDYELVDGVASSRCRLPARAEGDIVSVFGHEHELGKSFRMVLNEGSDDEKVLLDIPRWDFDWQLNYVPVEKIQIEPSDRITIECSWDRGLRDPSLEPAYVLWADGSDDEMCFATIVTRERSG